MNKKTDKIKTKKSFRQSFNLKNFELFKRLPYCLLLIFLSLTISSVSFAQDIESSQDLPKDAEPPPLKVISKEERDLLSKEIKIKERTKLSLELMNLKLLKAEEYNSKTQYKEMFKELGKFHALIDNALWFLNRNNTDSGKVLNNFKRLEMGLREFLPRLELIRRELPLNFEYYVKSLIVNVREARSKAVDPLFDNTVVPDNSTGN